ncbi:MAG: alpha-N-arabinofuranosidase [Armatimonadota bacterium]|nr:MAG: alpha-N-arabinofuranosidase [Armatimonadota bacterium]
MACACTPRLTSVVALAAATALLLIASTAARARADGATLTVNLRQPGAGISPMLWGIFFEEINHAGDGGIYAELVRNRSFEDADAPDSWSLVTSGAATGSAALDDAHPLNDAHRRSLRLEITRADGGRVGVANAGYWGIAVKEGEQYVLSLHASCSEDFNGPLMVSLEHAAGLVYGQARLEGLGEQWQRFTCVLSANRTDPSARLVIAASAPGTVWLDTVSLFPKSTWHTRPNGLRADLAGTLADMKPSFVRFPGGCFVEGDVLENAFRWKNTIGDIAARPGHWNLWGYRSTDGLGYHEHLEMCEDLGAEPMFVINCGMAHGGNVPLAELAPWVQDALDAIEYANGPTTSTWGALRAKHGHPDPFDLKYVEIGNENGGPAYEERYARFHDAIKERYPDIQLIADVPVTSRDADIVDEHYYSSPEWFITNATRYDKRDRGGPKIFVGEYACTQQCGQGNLRAALAEAAFMTGLERNSDLVVMAAYAPLFVNVNDRRWNPDAICFDSSSAYGTPSYYVQKLFGEHRGDVVLPTELVVETGPLPTSGGAIGLATWNTQAEFTDIRVTHGDETLFAAGFGSGAPGWRVVRGEWSAQEGAYRQAAAGEDLRVVAGDANWGDYAYSLKARKLGGAEGFLIMFRVRDDGNWLWWNLGGWGNARHAIEKCVGGGKTILGDSVPGRIETGRWYDIRIELQGFRIRCYLDGDLIHDVEDVGPAPMTAVASRVSATGEVIVKVVNTSNAAHDTEVTLEGVSAVDSEGMAVTLTANSPDDENSLSQPTKVSPVTRRVTGLGRAFRYAFPPNSLTILRIGVTQAAR